MMRGNNVFLLGSMQIEKHCKPNFMTACKISEIVDMQTNKQISKQTDVTHVTVMDCSGKRWQTLQIFLRAYAVVWWVVISIFSD